ncbi:PREDICTED: inositol polyphosphate multikinase beta [Tarenaya hassleriana]|uniref:inositol polyphosphate multikinase beta n=1 Tax=Tarenaya hassleriana TaxID=28532 RepID=UPI00053C6284|nr:PREDICTED: inositol polyphosphate multikinase beta [Tarenaya hassleriana]XP_010546121.1 PREDICTED: inositol polyphosphate multikinase beta [Tarenaya hassleriana]XP_010546122.1 PREDICTED: inositol polyphosphate multikinase beta [Tarenaya hassleriana]
MLKVPEHQVAGHEARAGGLGPLIDDEGRFYKPLQGDARGEKEVKFYQSFWTNKKVPGHIRRFFPMCHGTELVEASDGTGLRPHLVLQDVVKGYSKPSVMDVKIGSRTWYPDVSEEYIRKCIRKDTSTTSVLLGFRISGMRGYDHKALDFWRPDKKVVLGFSVDAARLALRKFVSSNSAAKCDPKPDCALASRVYGGSDGILAQLLKLKAWFEDQTLYHFNSCSILLVYENESILDGGDPRAQVKLVDFAHVLEDNGVIDHNFLGGLCSFIKCIRDILESSDDCSETETPCLENGH